MKNIMFSPLKRNWHTLRRNILRNGTQMSFSPGILKKTRLTPAIYFTPRHFQRKILTERQCRMRSGLPHKFQLTHNVNQEIHQDLVSCCLIVMRCARNDVFFLCRSSGKKYSSKYLCRRLNTSIFSFFSFVIATAPGYNNKSALSLALSLCVCGLKIIALESLSNNILAAHCLSFSGAREF